MSESWSPTWIGSHLGFRCLQTGPQPPATSCRRRRSWRSASGRRARPASGASASVRGRASRSCRPQRVLGDQRRGQGREPEQDQHHDQQAAGGHQRRRAEGRVWRHGALNDMAAALLDASLVALLAVVTVSDLRTRLVPDRALVAGLVVALPDLRAVRSRRAPGAARRRGRRGGLPARRRADPPGRHGPRATSSSPACSGSISARRGRGAAGRLRGRLGRGARAARAPRLGGRCRTIPFAPFLALGGAGRASHRATLRPGRRSRAPSTLGA